MLETIIRCGSILLLLFCGNKNNDDDTVLTTMSTTTKNRKKEEHTIPTLFGSESFGMVWSLSYPYFRTNREGRCLFLWMLVIVVLNGVSSVLFSFASKNMYNALNSMDPAAFGRTVLYYGAVLFLYAPVIALYNYQRERLAVHWRSWMTKRTLRLYYNGQNRNYYFLERGGSSSSGSKIDNPDQRIAEDINAFCTYSLKLLIMTLKNGMNLISFSIILYTIAPQLFLVIIAYVFVGTIVTFGLGKPLIHLNYINLQREADFRFSLVRLRENCECIAFYKGEDLELNLTEQRFDKVITNRLMVLWKEFRLEIFTNIYTYMTWILPVAVVAPFYFQGQLQLGDVTQARDAFYNVVSDISIIVREFADISRFSAGIHRLGSFYDAMNNNDNDNISAINDTSPIMSSRNNDNKGNANLPELKEEDNNSNSNHSSDDTSTATSTSSSSTSPDTKTKKKHKEIQIIPLPLTATNTTNDLILSLDQLNLWTPKERLLIRDLTISLQVGQHLMIMGNSGTGKSTLLRSIAGLWKTGSGTIRIPSSVYFLPQRPYCPLGGSLRDQLLYPSFGIDANDTAVISIPNNNLTSSYCRAVKDEELLDMLKLVHLSNLAEQVGGLDAVLEEGNWSNILSLGEQQRLGFARAFLNRPSLFVMDEATSALDTHTQTHLYSVLQCMATASNNNNNDNNPNKVVRIPFSDDDNSSSSNTMSFRPIDGGFTYLSVGHRPSLIPHHRKKLFIRETGEYDLTDIDDQLQE